MPASVPLLKGTLDVLVLKALTLGAKHGFEITCWLEERSAGALCVEDSALYQALYRMEQRDLIGAEWGVTENNRRARYYRLTAKGRAHLRVEGSVVTRFAQTIATILSDQPA